MSVNNRGLILRWLENIRTIRSVLGDNIKLAVSENCNINELFNIDRDVRKRFFGTAIMSEKWLCEEAHYATLNVQSRVHDNKQQEF